MTGLLVRAGAPQRSPDLSRLVNWKIEEGIAGLASGAAVFAFSIVIRLITEDPVVQAREMLRGHRRWPRETRLGSQLRAAHAEFQQSSDDLPAFGALFPHLPVPLQREVHDRRLAWEICERLVVWFSLTTIVWIGLLVWTWRWLPAVFVPASFALLAYRSAVTNLKEYVSAVKASYGWWRRNRTAS